MIDGEGTEDVDVLVGAPRCERQLVQVAGIVGGATLAINGFSSEGVTDHNGYFYKLYTGSGITGTANLSAQGANAIQALSYGDVFLQSVDPYILSGLYGLFDYTQLTSRLS